MRKALAIMSVAIFSIAAFAVTNDNEKGAYVLDHSMQDIDGNTIDLSNYKGKVLLVVNVASKCGLTPQYEDLVALHKKYAEKGLAVLGFPANNFGSQEPGSDEEIKEFCSLTYGVDFDMFSKISVQGENKAPLYEELTSAETNGSFGGEIKWNFTKFLVDKEGNVIARFEPRTKPNAPEVIAAIEKALTQ